MTSVLWSQLRELVVLHGGGSMDVTVRRGTEVLTFHINVSH